MECKNVKDQLYEYIFGELNTEKCYALELHMNACEECKKEYTMLKKLLIDDAVKLQEFGNRIEMPEELNGRVKAAIGRQKIFKTLKYLTAACLALVLLYSTPVLVYYAGQLFPFERYMDFLDKDTIIDFEEGRGQVIGKSTEMNGVIFTIDGMIKKGDKYNILFTIKIPQTKEYNYGFPAGGFNVITVQDQFGKKYSVGSASGTTARALKDGESQYIFEIAEPLHFWSYKLTVRITAIELGYTNENEKKYFEKYKNIYGDWNVDFKVNRSIDWR